MKKKEEELYGLEDDEDDNEEIRRAREQLEHMDQETKIREQILKFLQPLVNKQSEQLVFQEKVRNALGRLEQRLDKLQEKLSGENIKIWAPFLDVLIEKRLVDYVNFITHFARRTCGRRICKNSGQSWLSWRPLFNSNRPPLIGSMSM